MDREWNDSQPIYRQIRDRVVAMILDGLGGVVVKKEDDDRTINLAAAPIRPIRTEAGEPHPMVVSPGGVQPHDVGPRIDEVDARV